MDMVDLNQSDCSAGTNENEPRMKDCNIRLKKLSLILQIQIMMLDVPLLEKSSCIGISVLLPPPCCSSMLF